MMNEQNFNFSPSPPPIGPVWLARPAQSGVADRLPAQRFAGEGQRLIRKRVLIVEDEALLAMDLQFAFEDEGAEIIGPALSLEQAIRAAASGDRIDGAVLDVDLGGHDVFPVAHMLQERGVPFVFHTGHGSRASLSETFPGSATCIKPTLPETLIETLLRLAR